jgi:hypothetical protein
VHASIGTYVTVMVLRKPVLTNLRDVMGSGKLATRNYGVKQHIYQGLIP